MNNECHGDVYPGRTQVEVMLNKSVLNYYSHFSSFFPDFFPAIVFYSSRCIDSDKKKSRDIKK